MEIARAYVQIIPSAKGIQGKLSQALNSEAGGAGNSAGLTLGNNLVGTIKKVVAAAGIGAFVQKALSAGGALQQSYGGLETIYGDAAEAAKKYATEAAAAGLSANEYAEQAVSFGASLKQAFAGDTTKAVEAANTAILDMQDNSAKMGTEISMIQNAYQGFAKQNYTMLDNLKLGYGGTKKEMERLLADAERLSGVKYDISNLGDVYQAIHVIQQDLGLTGVAAAEASNTFTGSMGAMKAAAQNLMANLALGEDVSGPLKVLVGNARVFLTNNMLPMVMNVVKGVFTGLVPAIASMASEMGPQILPALQKLIGQVQTFFTTTAPQMIEAAKSLISGLISGIMAAAPQLLAQGRTIVTPIITGIVQALPGIIATIQGRMMEMGRALFDNVIMGAMSKLPELITTAGAMITPVVEALAARLPELLAQGQAILSYVVTGIMQKLPDIVTAVGSVFNSFVGAFVAHLPEILQQGWELLKSLVAGIVNNLPQLIVAVAQVVAQFIATVGAHLPEILETGIKILGELIAGILNAIPKLQESLPRIFEAIKGAFASFDFKSIGANILNGIKEGILGAVSNVVEAAKTAGSSILQGFKDRFGIESPSKVMAAEVGAMIPAGIAVGIEKNAGVVQNAMRGIAEDTAGSYNAFAARSRRAVTPMSAQTEFMGLAEALGSRPVQVSVGLYGDAAKILKVVQKENAARTRATRYNTLALR